MTVEILTHGPGTGAGPATETQVLRWLLMQRERMTPPKGTSTRETKAHLKVLETVLLGCKDPNKAQSKREDPGAHILWLEHMGQ